MIPALNFPRSSIPYRLQVAAQNDQSSAESQSTAVSQVDRGNDKVTLNSQISRLDTEHNVKQKELSKKHDIEAQRLEKEYATAQSRIEQEYARKKNSLKINLYV